jgi:hypothetical protein
VQACSSAGTKAFTTAFNKPCHHHLAAHSQRELEGEHLPGAGVLCAQHLALAEEGVQHLGAGGKALGVVLFADDGQGFGGDGSGGLLGVMVGGLGFGEMGVNTFVD